MRSLARNDHYRKLVVRWYEKNRGEQVRVRPTSWQAFRHRSGAVYPVDNDLRLKAGDRAVNIARVFKKDKIFLCAFDTALAANKKDDSIVELIEWSLANEISTLSTFRGKEVRFWKL